MPTELNPSEVIAMLNRQPIPTNHVHILLVSMPKCASTYLSRLLDGIPGLAEKDLVPTYDFREQELGRPELLIHHHSHYFGKCHLRHSSFTSQAICNFGLKPVFTYRNLFDVIVSLVDHYREGDFQPMAIPPMGLANLSDEEMCDFVIDFIAPWLINFYVSWTHYNLPILRLGFEEVTQNPEQSLEQILSFSGFQNSPEAIQAAVDAAKTKSTRLNKGVSGRGLQTLTNPQIDRIRGLTKPYSGTDFAPIGL